MQVGIIIVNYNTEQEIVRLVNSLKEQTYSDFKVVVVDNCSPDGSGARLKSSLIEIEIILSQSNLGFAAGVNQGIKFLRRINSPPEYYWILNPDMEVDSFALEAVANCAKSTNGVVGSKVLYPAENNISKIWSAGGLIDFTNLNTSMRGNGEIDTGQYSIPISCDYLPGCSLFIPKKIIDDIGLFPEDYFLYFEETDWCCRAKRRGYELTYEPTSVVTHYFKEEKLAEPLVVYYYNRNRKLFFFRYGGFLTKLKIIFGTISQDLIKARKSFREAPDENYKKIFLAHIQSCLDFLFRRFGKRK